MQGRPFYSERSGTLEEAAQRVAGAPFQETSKARLDMALSNLVLLKMSLLIGVALDDVRRFPPTQTII